MKTQLCLRMAGLVLLLSSVGLQAQSTIMFNNYVPNELINAPVSGPNNGALLSGAGYTAQLYAAPLGQPESAFMPLPSQTTFRTGAAAGYVIPVSVSAPFPSGQAFAVQMVVWDNGGGTVNSYAAATVRGKSQIINLFGPITYLHGLQPFHLAGDSPEVTRQPQSLVLSSGSRATFSVTAYGNPPLSYQWRFNGSNLTGATDSFYTLAQALSANAGYYDVVVTNASGTNLSAAASLSFLDLNRYSGLMINGPVGARYRVDFNTALDTNWMLLTNLTLTTQSQVSMDIGSSPAPKKFYRALPQ